LTVLAGLAAAAAFSSACGSDEGSGGVDNSLPSCDEDTRDEDYFSGISKTGEAGYTVAIVDSLPAPPAKGDNQWTVELQDASGAPLPDMILETAQFMPDHGHSSLIPAVLTDMGAGTYMLDPINMFMPGYWETTVDVLDPGATDSPDDDTKVDTVVFKFCVEG